VKGRDFDRMVAAHAISARAVLVTNHSGDFRDIPQPNRRKLRRRLARAGFGR
jgi:predicted nucleic acid-binding protein